MEQKQLTKQDNKAVKNMVYWYKHREELLEKKREYRKIMTRCSCGVDVSRNHLSEHIRTKTHNQLVEQEKKDRIQILEDKTSPDITKLILTFL